MKTFRHASWIAAAVLGIAATAQIRAQDGSDNVERVPDVKTAARALRRAASSEKLPAVGEVAPDFALKLLEESNAPEYVPVASDGRVRLTTHRGKKPVVLIFGSYT